MISAGTSHRINSGPARGPALYAEESRDPGRGTTRVRKRRMPLCRVKEPEILRSTTLAWWRRMSPCHFYNGERTYGPLPGLVEVLRPKLFFLLFFHLAVLHLPLFLILRSAADNPARSLLISTRPSSDPRSSPVPERKITALPVSLRLQCQPRPAC